MKQINLFPTNFASAHTTWIRLVVVVSQGGLGTSIFSQWKLNGGTITLVLKLDI